jgi:hypothetical protein
MSNQPPTGPANPAQPKTQQQLTPEQQAQRQIQAFMRAPVPRFYANGLGIGHTAADISVVFLGHGAPVAVATMSFPTAKSLVNDLSQAISKFEQETGEEVHDINEITKRLNTKKA